MKNARTLTAIVGLSAMSIASSALAQPNLLVDPGLETLPVAPYTSTLNNFSTGVWGVEQAAIVAGPASGPLGPVNPFQGNNMLCMTDDGLVITQGVQVIDLSHMQHVIDDGCADVRFSAHLNASVFGAQANLRLYYHATPVWNPCNPLGCPGTVLTLDPDPTTWETLTVTDTIPAGTRWLVAEVAYDNASIGTEAGYVDGVKLTITSNKLHNMLAVSNTNELMRVNLNVLGTPPTPTATSMGITQDAGGGPVRRVRGLAFVGPTLYGMTREGDLVTVDPASGITAFVHSVATAGQQFWSGLTHRVESGADILYTVNAFGGHELVRIDLSGSVSHTIQGATTSPTGFVTQMLGAAFATVDGVEKLVASNRQNQNVVDMDPTDGSFDFTWSNATSGVTNNQQIGVHPGTGVLWGIHDHSLSAVVSTFDMDTTAGTQLSTFRGTLPFGIAESVGGGMDTYGWGGIAFIECKADFDCNGLVNFFDIAAFLNAFAAGNPIADLAAPFGVLDFFDIQAFLRTFGDCT